MSSKNHRSGGKYCWSHTTVIDVVDKFIDNIHSISDVKKISIGLIQGGLKAPRCGSSLKIGYGKNGCILLQFRGNTTQQEIYVYTSNVQSTKLSIAREALANNINISFEKKYE